MLSQTRWLLGAALCMTLYAAATAGQAWIMEPMLDHVFLQRDRAMLLLVPVAIVVLALLKGVAGYGQVVADGADRPARDRRAAAAAVRPSGARRSRLRRGRSGPGPLLSRMTYDTQQLRLAVTSALTTVVRDVLTMLGLVALMVHQNWQLAAARAGRLPARHLADRSASAGACARSPARARATWRASAGRLEQSLRGLRQVKADNRATTSRAAPAR